MVFSVRTVMCSIMPSIPDIIVGRKSNEKARFGFLSYLWREFGNRIMVRAIPLRLPGLIGKSLSVFLGYSHWSMKSMNGRSGKMKPPWVTETSYAVPFDLYDPRASQLGHKSKGYTTRSVIYSMDQELGFFSQMLYFLQIVGPLK